MWDVACVKSLFYRTYGIADNYASKHHSCRYQKQSSYCCLQSFLLLRTYFGEKSFNSLFFCPDYCYFGNISETVITRVQLCSYAFYCLTISSKLRKLCFLKPLLTWRLLFRSWRTRNRRSCRWRCFRFFRWRLVLGYAR